MANIHEITIKGVHVIGLAKYIQIKYNSQTQNTYSHPACHTVQLRSLKPHPLNNTEKRTSL